MSAPGEAVQSAALRRLLELCSGAVQETSERLGEATACIESARLHEVMRALQLDPALRFEMLMDLTAVDHPGREPRFDVVYHLYSPEHAQRLRIKVGVSEQECGVDTMTGLWPAADWLEREVWDLYGIHFRGHPDLRRILLYEEFEGHPLRKDYPKTRRQPLVSGLSEEA
jgi:NADH-quinone oxidoreductase subunit C